MSPSSSDSALPSSVRADVHGVLLREPRAVIIVEGRSDAAAVDALARRRGRNLAEQGIELVAAEGATNIGHFVRAFGPLGADLAVAGLYDVAEEAAVRRGLREGGLQVPPASDGLAAAGFHVCVDDLEDELIRALGTDRVLGVVEAEGEASSFATFQRQPAQRDRPIDAQLHRFVGTRSGRKVRYGRLLVEALALDDVPAPLDAVLAFV